MSKIFCYKLALKWITLGLEHCLEPRHLQMLNPKSYVNDQLVIII